MGASALSICLAALCVAQEAPQRWLQRLPASAATRPAPARVGGDLLLQEPQIQGGALQRRRLELRNPEPRRNIVVQMHRSRSGAMRRVSDLREAWTVSAGSSLTWSLPSAPARRLLASVGIEQDRGEPWPGTASLQFHWSLRVGAKVHELGVSSLQETDRWQDIDLALPAAEEAALLQVEVRLQSPVLPLNVQAALAHPVILGESYQGPRVVLVSIDTLRADHLGCYGYPKPTTPHLDAVASRGIRFENCTSPSPWTLPSYGSLLTGLYPSEHRAGVMPLAEGWGGGEARPSKIKEALAEGIPTLAGQLREAGFLTAAFFANPFLSSQSGLDRGFVQYTWFEYSARSGVDLAIDWLQRHGSRPFFLFLQLLDPHWPYAPPAPYDEQFAGLSVDDLEKFPPTVQVIRNNPQSEDLRRRWQGLYDGEIAFTDAQVGRLLDALEQLGLQDDLLLVIHADHGEELWDHGLFEHGHTLHRELVRVPLLFEYPGVLPAGEVIPNFVRSTDVAPTILDLVGLPVPGGLRGTSLVPLLKGEQRDAQLIGFAESILWGRPYVGYQEAKCLIADGYKLIVADGSAAPQLYHLENDPGEQNDLVGQHPQLVEELQRRLLRLHQGAPVRAGEELRLSEEDRERLRQLGYIEDE